jgi:hypothetical protein
MTTDPADQEGSGVLVLSLSTVIQEAASDPNLKKISGNINSFDKLLAPESLALLEKSHNGVFAFLAFHPAVDSTIVSYIKGGTLPSDSGRDILVLFSLDAQARWATAITSESFSDWLTVDLSVHPSYELLRFLFDPERPPPLPGIVFFSAFTGEAEVVYVKFPLISSEAEARSFFRNLFSLVDKVWHSSAGKPSDAFTDRLAAALSKEKFEYAKTGRVSMREWLVKSMNFLAQQNSDIVTLIWVLP